MTAKQTILITGGNRGIGLEVARVLAERGAHVFIGARDPAKGKEAAVKLSASGKVTFVPLDVADPVSIQRASASLGGAAPAVDVLINNAALFDPADESVLALTSERLERTLLANTLGPLRMVQAFLPLLRKSKTPRIINISSGAGSLNDMGHFAPGYAISKAALNAVTRQLAAALKDEKIAVNSVCPGWVRTEMGGPNAPRSIEEGAAGIVWLALDAPQALTGKFLRDGKEIAW